jgi:hypothetical protein
MSRAKRVGRAALIGAASGLAASWVMNQYWVLEGKLKEEIQPNEQGREAEQQQEQKQHAPENPTVKVAESVSREVLHRDLRDGEKEAAGAAIHYLFGAAMGAFYGVLTEVAPATRSGFGLGYAAVLWLAADEILVPALRLSAPPTGFPVSKHLEGLGAHLVYGATTEAVRRALQWAA